MSSREPESSPLLSAKEVTSESQYDEPIQSRTAFRGVFSTFELASPRKNSSIRALISSADTVLMVLEFIALVTFGGNIGSSISVQFNWRNPSCSVADVALFNIMKSFFYLVRSISDGQQSTPCALLWLGVNMVASIFICLIVASYKLAIQCSSQKPLALVVILHSLTFSIVEICAFVCSSKRSGNSQQVSQMVSQWLHALVVAFFSHSIDVDDLDVCLTMGKASTVIRISEGHQLSNASSFLESWAIVALQGEESISQLEFTITALHNSKDGWRGQLALRHFSASSDLDIISLQTFGSCDRPIFPNFTKMRVVNLRRTFARRDPATLSRTLGQLFSLATTPEEKRFLVKAAGIKAVHSGGARKPLRVLHAWFEETAHKFSSNVAVAEAIVPASSSEFIASANAMRGMTYGELNQRSTAFAASLRSLGIGSGTFIGLRMARSADAYTAMLGILKNGCAYVPLDPAFPPDRVAFIMNDCKAQLLVSDSPSTGPHTVNKLPDVLPSWEHGKVLSFCEVMGCAPDQSGVVAPPQKVDPEQIAYAIYTSGSTGRPKGVLIPHRAISVLVAAEQQSFLPKPHDRVYQGFSIAFDASLEEIWLAFATGATLVPCPDSVAKNPSEIPTFLFENRITIFSTVPTLLSMLDRTVDSVRLLILGGETCTPELLDRWHNGKRRIINSYGPTEASVVSHFREYTPGQPLTIGQPLPHYTGFVMDQRQKLLPPGVPGELCLGGPALAAGYINQGDLTARSFVHVEDPITGYSGVVYRTGDLVRYSETGEVDYLGRIDLQVKIRGYRVELGEIENILKQSDPEIIKQAAVLVHVDDGVQRLVAYLLVDEASSLDTVVLRERIKVHLAAYMIPSRFVRLTSFPTLPSGKLDRNRLKAEFAELGTEPEVETVDASSNDPSLSLDCRAGTEQIIMRIWRKHLAIDKPFTTGSDFFDLGGNSLLATLIINELRKTVSETVSIRDLYSLRTVAALSENILRRRQSTKNVKPNQKQIHQEGLPLPPPASPLAKFCCGVVQFLFVVMTWFSFCASLYFFIVVIRPLETSLFVTTLIFLCGYVVLFVVHPILAVVVKWLLIGRFEEGVHPVYGWYYIRFWLFKHFLDLAPVRTFISGTPLAAMYLWALGSKVGNNIHISTTRVMATDLLSIGDNCSINKGTNLSCYSVERGYLFLRPISLGSNCHVGANSDLEPGSSMCDGSSLGDLSRLNADVEIPRGEEWHGSPAKPFLGVGKDNPRLQDPSVVEKALQNIFIFTSILLLVLIPLGNMIVSIGMYLWLRERTHCSLWGCLAIVPLISIQGLLMNIVSIIVLKWALCGRLQAGSFSVYSVRYVKHWLADQLIDESIVTLRAIYATLYTPWFMRALGASVGPGAEISTVGAIQPDLLIVGPNTFLADMAMLGPTVVRGNVCTLGSINIGEKTFVGNGALIPSGTLLGKRVLVGVNSMAPPGFDGAKDDTNWFGSPSLLLPRRKIADSNMGTTFEPPVRLVLLRLFIEFFKIFLPALMTSSTVILTSQTILYLTTISNSSSPKLVIGYATIVLAMSILGFSIFSCTLKWILVGRYKKEENPLWSLPVWLNEFVTSLCENYVFPFAVNPFLGSPFATWFFTLMGSHIGSNCFCDTTQITEFDLIEIGDDVTLDSQCNLQTHLFEDRIMKQSKLVIKNGASVGDGAYVLYDTLIGNGAALGSTSLLMKGEVISDYSKWSGIPAEFISESKLP